MSAPITPDMTPHRPDAARWAQVEEWFQHAVGLDGDARRDWLASACPDSAMRHDVEALLQAHGKRGALDRLIDDVMAPLLPHREAATHPPVTLPSHSRYRIIERLGAGGMGVVYRARDERLDRDIALKFLSPYLSADEVAKRRFLVEARAAAAIEHPNICTVHEIGDTDDGQLYIVMACYDGETLDRRIARGPLPLDEALRIAAEMTRGLAKAHDRGIVHRDIKPANVMVTTDGLVKILDFGIAKLTDTTTTQTVGAIGTVAYMSPEQAFGEVVDHRTDLWSLGVVLYEMLTGVRPFRGPGDKAVLVAALSSDPDSVHTLRPGIPPSVDAVIRRALAKRAQDRYANAAELLAALQACGPHTLPFERGAPASSGVALGVADDDSAARRHSTLARGGERRQVTVVACTLDGQEPLFERLSLDEADQVLADLRGAADAVATQFGGIVNHWSGDELVLLFGVPVAHDEDAVRGVRAALALRTRVTELASALDPRLGAGLRLRAGVHVGLVVAQPLRGGDRHFRITGAAADVAARLGAAAEADTILISPETRRLVAPFVQSEPARAVSMHGDTAAITPHRVVRASDVRSRLENAALAGLTPFVGRERERALLADHCASATSGSGRVTVLIGEAGAGKSRLLHELRDVAAGAGMRVLEGRCDAYGGTTPFLPFIDFVQSAFGMLEGGTASERHEAVVAAARAVDAALEEYLPLYLALLAVPSEAHPVPEHLRGEAFQSAMLEAMAVLLTLSARTMPTLLVLEDWHWADDASREVLRQLVEIVAAFPLMLVVTSRPDASTDWGSAEHQHLMHLAPLDPAACSAIARAVLGAEHVAPELAARLHERTGGNPFFLEEVCEALREEGALAVTDGVVSAAVESAVLHVPETVQGVLRTRIDRLQDDARDVLRVAAVIGREFTRGVLEDVVNGGELASALERLKASGLVQQTGVVPEPAYRFKHALTQEVAYDSLLEHQRVSLHASVGASIERRHAVRLDEHAERLAYHFSRAEQWTQAVRYGLLAADRAKGLSQNSEALNTLERAALWVVRLPEDVARRELLADVMLRQERLSEMLGLRDRQLEIADTLISTLAPFGPSERLVQVYLRQGDAFTLLNRFEAAERSLQTALRIATEREDRLGERSALRSIAFLRSHEGRHADALEKIEEVLAIGRAIGDTRSEAGDLATLGNVLRASGQPERALEVLEAALERTEISANSERYGYLLNVVGTVHRDLGHLDEALEYYRRTAPYMSLPHYASFTLPAVAHIQLQQGQIEEALATAREAVELNRKARYADGSAAANRTLGELLMGLDRHVEALPYLRDAALLYAQLQNRENEILMQRRLASVHELLGESADAHALWSQLHGLYLGRLELALAAEAAEGMARTGRQLAGGTQQSIAQYEEAISLSLRQGDRARELSVRNSLGIVHWERGAYADAVRQYEAALRICRETGDDVHEGLILNSLGASLHRLQRWDEARTVLADAVRVTSAVGERQLHAHALGLLGEVCLAVGRLGDARTHVEASLSIRRQLQDRRGEGWMLERLARIYPCRVTPLPPPRPRGSPPRLRPGAATRPCRPPSLRWTSFPHHHHPSRPDRQCPATSSNATSGR